MCGVNLRSVSPLFCQAGLPPIESRGGRCLVLTFSEIEKVGFDATGLENLRAELAVI